MNDCQVWYCSHAGPDKQARNENRPVEAGVVLQAERRPLFLEALGEGGVDDENLSGGWACFRGLVFFIGA